MAGDEQDLKRRKSESNKRYYQKRKQLELQDPKLAEADKEHKKHNQRDKWARDRSKVQEDGPWSMVLDLTDGTPTFEKDVVVQAVQLHHMDSSEVLPKANMVWWPNGQTTALPTIMRDGQNMCEGDAKYVH